MRQQCNNRNNKKIYIATYILLQLKSVFYLQYVKLKTLAKMWIDWKNKQICQSKKKYSYEYNEIYNGEIEIFNSTHACSVGQFRTTQKWLLVCVFVLNYLDQLKNMTIYIRLIVLDLTRSQYYLVWKDSRCPIAIWPCQLFWGKLYLVFLQKNWHNPTLFLSVMVGKLRSGLFYPHLISPLHLF